MPIDWATLFDAEGGSIPTITTVTTLPHSAPNCVHIYNGMPAATATMLVAPPISSTIPINNLRLKVWVRGMSTTYGLGIGILEDPLDASTYTEVLNIDTPNTWTELVVPFDSYTGNGRYIAIKHGNTGSNQAIFIDDVTLELIADTDLAVLELTGDATPAANSPTTYTAHVHNWGTLAQDTYTVTLHDSDGNLLATADGVAVSPGTTVEVPIVWTPTQPGAYSIYAKVNLAGDQNSTNDQSPLMPVSVLDAGTIVITIGDGTATNTPTGAPTPYGTWYKNFRQQYMFKADELQALGAEQGLFTCLAFEVSSVNNCSPMPDYTIRFKHTQLNSLTTTFEVGEYTQVYYQDNFQPVNGWNVHVFDTPFIWNGVDNLLVDITTTLIPGACTQNASVFYTPTTGTNTSLRFQSDIAPAASNEFGVVGVNRANIKFFLNVTGMGSLSGTVTSGGVAVADVNIDLEDSIYHTTTDALGHYSFSHVQPGTYNVTASKLGFESVTLPVTIVEDVASTLDFNLPAATSVSVTGFVAGSDQPTVGLEGANVSLTGIMEYSAVTDATGHFTIPGVLSGNTYSYLITCEGYSELRGTVTVGSENYDMQTLILDEVAYPPSGVIAEENVEQTEVSLIWNTPTIAPPYDDFEQNDGGWVPTASWDPVGDWEWTNSYDVDNFVDSYGATTVIPPPTAYSGTGMWGTKIYTNYTNAGGTNMLTKNFNLNGILNPEIRWQSWENVFGSFDYCQLRVNDTIVWGPSWDYTNTQWQERVVSLANYAGQTNVVITFEMYASTVVNYAGWYIDDVYVGPALDRTVVQAPAITPTCMYGLDELAAAAKADELALLKPSRATQRSREPQRVLTGYKVWRLLTENHENEDLWTLLTPTAVADTTYIDTAWQPLPSGVYQYAVKAVYSNEILSDPAFSNELNKGMMGTISGTVTEFGTGNPISGAAITAGDYSTTSNADGSYAFLVYQGTYNVTCTKTGYQNAIYPDVLVVGQQVTALPIVLTEVTLPPLNVEAVIESPESVGVTWDSPTDEGPDGSCINPFSRIDTSTRGDRALLGYRVWRLSQGAEGNENLWTSLTPEPLTETSYSDTGWQNVPDGSYRWAVKAVYTGGALSPAALSEALIKVTHIGTIAGIVRSNTNVPVRGATITCGDIVATTNDSGAYSMQVEEGTYTLVASHPNYNTETVENVIVYANQTTTQNFIMTAVDNDDNVQIPVATSLNGNYPNPFNPETTISFSLKEPANVSIEIYNVQGKLVRTLVNEERTAGNYTVIWDGRDSGGRNVASGVYYYRMRAGKYSSTRKMIMLK